MNHVELLREAILGCQRCGLHKQCTQPVPFHGAAPNRVAVVGEAPGQEEDEKCRPFIGPPGVKISGLLNQVGIDPDDVTWLNTVSCFPHGTPAESHVNACRVNKLAQLDLVDPAFVLILGSVALRGFRSDVEIGRARGRPFRPANATYVCFAVYHPSAALRNRTFEIALTEDLTRFAEMIRDPDWRDECFDCWYCNAPAWWWDADGVASCETHMPTEAKRRQAWLKADHLAVCDRLGRKEHHEDRLLVP